MKLLRRMLLGLLLLLCATALLLAWLVHTESGTRALVRFAAGASGGGSAVHTETQVCG